MPICASVNGAVCIVGMAEMCYRRDFELNIIVQYYMKPLAGMSNECRRVMRFSINVV